MKKQAYMQVNVLSDKSQTYDVNIIEKEEGRFPLIIEVNAVDESHAEELLMNLDKAGFEITATAYRYI